MNTASPIRRAFFRTTPVVALSGIAAAEEVHLFPYSVHVEQRLAA